MLRYAGPVAVGPALKVGSAAAYRGPVRRGCVAPAAASGPPSGDAACAPRGEGQVPGRCARCGAAGVGGGAGGARWTSWSEHVRSCWTRRSRSRWRAGVTLLRCCSGPPGGL